MRILGLGILRYNPDTPEPIMLQQACELSHFGFFQRGSVREMITFFNKTIAKRTPPGQRQSVQNEEYFVHIYMRADGKCRMYTVYVHRNKHRHINIQTSTLLGIISDNHILSYIFIHSLCVFFVFSFFRLMWMRDMRCRVPPPRRLFPPDQNIGRL